MSQQPHSAVGRVQAKEDNLIGGSAPDSDNSQPAGAWRVVRQDDNGNRFVVQDHLSREAAELVAAEFESRGHKQTYWDEPEPVSARKGGS